jgi:ABC-type Fe3+-hydroxamate transport system substrate-binding protein
VGCREAGLEYEDHELRIVSLSPAITQVLIELGLRESIVAVGDFDELAPPDVPSLGRYIDLDLEKLLTLRPTHVLAMTGQAGLPEKVKTLAEQRGFALTDLDYPDTVHAALGLIEKVGEALERVQRGEALAGRVRFQLDGIAALTAERERPSALLAFSTERVMASGPGTVNDELLAIAGGVNAAADATVTAPIFDREKLRAIQPDVIFLMLPGQPPLTQRSDPRLASFRGLDLPAVLNDRVIVLNDPAVLLPGPSMATAAASMAVALHPDLAQPIAEVFRATP